jgi:hypothetical protein
MRRKQSEPILVCNSDNDGKERKTLLSEYSIGIVVTTVAAISCHDLNVIQIHLSAPYANISFRRMF